MTCYKIIVIGIVFALSLANRCVEMIVCKHSCDITQILIGYELSDVGFDWLVGNMSVYQENLLCSRSKQTTFSFICQIIFEKCFRKCYETVSHSPNSPCV